MKVARPVLKGRGRSNAPPLPDRALRHPVILRRISGGSQSERGNRWAERILSVNETCRRQRRSLHEYLLDAITASQHGRPIPTLVPG